MMIKKKSIIGYSVLLLTGGLVAWVSGQLSDNLHVFLRRSILGLILLIGATSGTALIAIQDIKPTEKATWDILKKDGRRSHILGEARRGLIFSSILTGFFLIRDYFRANSLVDNLGLYISLILICVFTFSFIAIRRWKVNERQHGR